MDVPAADVERFVRDGARHATGDAMTSCMIAAGANATKIKACRSTTVKDVLKASLGRTEVSDIDVERFVEDSGREATANAMKAAMKVAGTDDAAKEVAARAAAKDALKKSLGKLTIPDDVFQEYINDGARRSVADAMKACYDTATSDADKKACASSSAKEAL